MERLDSTGDNACTVCHDTMHIFAVGHCDHPVCYKCSTRMRVLCEQMDCPICRSTMPQVAFVSDKLPFKDIDLRRCIPNRKNKIFYENEEIEDMYLDLLEFRCRECPKRKPERTFSQLQTHMRREHQLFACDICLEHLKIFPYETKFYDRKCLAVHRRVGDKDDKSYKGHPLCEFCDARYLDKDELMKHLRKDHFFCHFCDQQGSNAYYNDYPDLLHHFEESHFLCTEDECGNSNTRFTHAFASEIDLKSHKATVHNMKSREMRTIQVDFQFAPRHQTYNRGNGINFNDYEDSGNNRQRHRNDRYGNRRRQQDDPSLQRALELSLQESTRPPVEERVPDPIQDFPTLNGLPVPQVQQKVTKPQKEDFPTLGASNNKTQKSTNGTREEDYPKLGTSTEKANKVISGSSREEDFPGLVSSKSKAKKATTGISKREEDFPSLGAANVKGGIIPDHKKYAAVSNITSDSPHPAVKKEKPRESQPVSLGSVKNVAKERWASQASSMTDEDYPSLKSKSKSGPRVKSAAGDNSSSSWLQKSSVTEVPESSSAASTVSIITEKPKVGSESQPKKHAPKVKPFTDDEEFPSLGGRTSRQSTVPGNITWTKPKSNSNNKKSFNSEPDKYDRGYFDPPDSKKSFEQHKEKNKSSGEGRANEAPKKNITINKKDFPGLPKGESEAKPHSSKKQVKGVEAKNVDSKIVESGNNKPKKNKKQAVDKSLNDIATGLMNMSTTSSKPNQKKTKLVDENGNKSKTSKKLANVNATDGNGNKPKVSKDSSNVKPSKPVVSQDSPMMNDDFVMAEKINESVSTANNNNSFPSHHAMSSSVQSTNAPPGFVPNSLQLQQPRNVSAPPGFSKPAPPGLSKPTFSVYDYIQPADFTSRNQVLVQNIKFCLETVEDGFDKFKAFSFQFRQGNISASAYYTNCQLLIGESDFKDIFPELLALLPDINKQQELWFEHQVVASVRSSSKGQAVSLKSLSPCDKCGQVVLNEDFQHHSLQHGGDTRDFPSLRDVSSSGATVDHNSNGPLKGAWIKASM